VRNARRNTSREPRLAMDEVMAALDVGCRRDRAGSYSATLPGLDLPHGWQCAVQITRLKFLRHVE
jgi:hypothetical protein